ncbi:hypothetical protein [Spirosoma agri]|uniref:Uncharacterized protein n=1 Tax=Spirosoma agri TaxID=1987381 RepID=A0A6M0ILE1_9BACT|nr:hypothetical protein [Spirosoma agri]NEU69109.1 hypothetical protein [Spirosoma agri]
MNITPLLIDSTDNEFNPDGVLTDWLKEIFNFQQCYKQLECGIRERVLEQTSAANAVSYVGQCPVNAVITLQATMTRELKRLSNDIEQCDTRTKSIASFDQLKSHTMRLKQLNHQAQTRLYLATLPAS